MAKADKGMRIFGVDGSTFTNFRVSKPSDGLYVDFASNNNTYDSWKVTALTGDGFDVDGPDNTFIDNVVTQADGYGSTVISSGNSFIDNKASKCGLADLQDTAGEGVNSYDGNSFGTVVNR